jgi:hypothetical protein
MQYNKLHLTDTLQYISNMLILPVVAHTLTPAVIM